LKDYPEAMEIHHRDVEAHPEALGPLWALLCVVEIHLGALKSHFRAMEAHLEALEAHIRVLGGSPG
jgi:hypothetical protein